MISTIPIVGGGQAGAQAVDSLRREGCDELRLRRQRPPLSKKYLAGGLTADRIIGAACIGLETAAACRHMAKDHPNHPNLPLKEAV